MALSVEMAGIEPATATLAGRARYLSCHPAGRLRHHLPRPAVFMVLTLWKCQLSSLYERLSGTINSAVNENRAGEAFSWAAAGECLLALTRQPLRLPGSRKPRRRIHVSGSLRRLARARTGRGGAGFGINGGSSGKTE